MNLRNTLVSGVAVLSIAALLAGNAIAQPPAAGGQPPRQGGGGGRGGRGMMAMFSIKPAFMAINPTQEQQDKFKALEDKMTQDRAAMPQDMDMQERMTKMQEMSKKFQSDVEALLTPEQKPKFADEMKKRANGPLLMDALTPLSLTDDQKKKIEPIAKDSQDALLKVQQDTTLQGRDRRDKMTQIQDEFKGKIRPLLTADQQTKLDTISFNPMGGRGGRRPGGATARLRLRPL